MKSSDSHWRPLSVEMIEGVPKRATQPEMKARATVSAVISGIGMASGQRVKRSMQVTCVLWSVGGVQQDQCGCGQSECQGWQRLIGV